MTDKEPLVSLIVAIYKSEMFLEKLLNSIINQTEKNLEIILVDDGSPDKSGEICDNYAEKDKRIKVIHKENAGACAARNDGIKAAQGDYLMIIDGDDWLENDYVEYLLNLALSTNSDMAMSDNVFTTRDRKQVEVDTVEIRQPDYGAAKLLYPNIPIGPWNKIYKSSLIKDNNISFSVKWSGEGLYFSVMAAQCSNQVAAGQKKVYNYRLNNLNSGLTNYNVVMGLNALENIFYIRDSLILKTPTLINAVDWHIWKNYLFLLKLIVATDSKDQYASEYIECKKNIRKRLPKALIKSKISLYEKVRMIYMSLFPISYINRDLRKSRIRLENDKME